jgi:hypothetical protein
MGLYLLGKQHTILSYCQIFNSCLLTNDHKIFQDKVFHKSLAQKLILPANKKKHVLYNIVRN